MIQLICSKCHADLSVDDAFAGGVCRCQHCGTIQTVPKKAKRDSKPAASKTIYTKPDAAKQGKRSELDALADAVVSSSGLSSKRLRQKTIEYAVHSQQKKPAWVLWAIIGAAAILAVVLLVLLNFLSSNSRSTAAVSISARPAGNIGPTGNSEVSSAPAPEFLGLPIDSPSVIYILDRGSGASEWFSYLLEATFRSTATLGSDRKFQILFWSNGDSDAAFPSGGPEFATESTVAAARKALDNLEARGQSDPMDALKRAFAKQPARLVIATGKGTQLDHTFTEQVMSLRGNQPTRIDTFNIADSEIGSALSDLSKQTGGVATLVSDSDLKRFAKQ